ncbi:MAG: SRPBCC family protein [Thermoplasmatota archaeon]
MRGAEGVSIRYERPLPQPATAVWRMLTEPNEIAKWFVRSELEARVGGRLVEHHDHVGATLTGRVLAFDAPTIYEHTWGEPAATVLWEIRPEGAGCRLFLTHRFAGAFDPGTAAGWEICLDVLEDVLSGAALQSAPPRGDMRPGAFHMVAPGTGRWTAMERLQGEYERAGSG